MHLLEVNTVTKRYKKPDHPAVDSVSLRVEPGELFGLLGPSGCGKTTLLRLIAGYETPDSGSIMLRDRDITVLAPEKRRIGFIFQDYALFPHLSVLNNVTFALRGTAKKTRAAKAMEFLELVGMDHLSARMPDQLSGGQQQRVAIARALAAAPDLLLMDEPFSNLDAGLRETTRREVRKILKLARMNAVLVTHDQDEALSFCDRLAVMNAGHIQQVGTPEEVYNRPRTSFSASFLGRANLLKGEAEGSSAHTHLGKIPIFPEHYGEVLLSLRPEHLDLLPAEGSSGTKVTSREFRGHDITYRVSHRGRTYIAHTDYSRLFSPGDMVELSLREPAVVIEHGLVKHHSGMVS